MAWAYEELKKRCDVAQCLKYNNTLLFVAIYVTKENLRIEKLCLCNNSKC